jgi:hypothetical protein
MNISCAHCKHDFRPGRARRKAEILRDMHQGLCPFMVADAAASVIARAGQHAGDRAGDFHERLVKNGAPLVLRQFFFERLQVHRKALEPVEL